MFLHAIQKYNTIRMIDELIRYPIYLASVLEIASMKASMYVPSNSYTSSATSSSKSASDSLME